MHLSEVRTTESGLSAWPRVGRQHVLTDRSVYLQHLMHVELYLGTLVWKIIHISLVFSKTSKVIPAYKELIL